MNQGHEATLTPGRTQPDPPPPPTSGSRMTSTAAGPWVTKHELTILVQTATRTGPVVEATGNRWAEYRKTGPVLLACNCGFTTGWVEAADLPNLRDLAKEHGGT